MKLLGSLMKLGFLFCLCAFVFTRCGGGSKDYVSPLTQMEQLEDITIGNLSLSIEEEDADFGACLKESITESYPYMHNLVDENVDVFYECQEKTNDSVTDSDKRDLAGNLVGWSQESLLAYSSFALTDSEEVKSVLISLLSKLHPHLDPFDDEDMSVIAEKSLFTVNEAEVEPFPEDILEGMYEGVIAYAPKGQGRLMATQLAGNYMHRGGSTLSVYENDEKETFYTSVMRKVSELIAEITVKQDSKDTLAENLFVKVIGSSGVKEKKKDDIIDVIAEILLNKDQDKKTNLKESAIRIVEESEASDSSEPCPGGEKRAIRYKDFDKDGRYMASTVKICSSSSYSKVASDLTAEELGNLDNNDNSDWDTDDDGVANDEDECEGTDDALIAYRYKDSDEDELYEKSSVEVCVDDETYTIAASELTEEELTNLDEDSETHWDLDGDGVANDVDECEGTDDALIAYRYKDSDEDGLYEKSSAEVCPDDETYTVAASELTAEELANLDDDAETHWDQDGDGVANDEDECEDIDDALMAYRYKDDDEDGEYAKSPEEVCPDDETYTVSADDLTTDEKTNLDSNDNAANDADADGVVDSEDVCNGTDDALIAIRYKDADDDGLMVASAEELCADDATYTFAASDITVYQINFPDSNDSSQHTGTYDNLTTTEALLGYDFDEDGTDDEEETINIITNMTAFELWRYSVYDGDQNSSHALVLKDLHIDDCTGDYCRSQTPSSSATWTGFTTLDGGGNTIDYGDDQYVRNTSQYGILFNNKESGVIRNITINANVKNNGAGIGGLIFKSSSTAGSELTIRNVTITGYYEAEATSGGVMNLGSQKSGGTLILDNVVNKAGIHVQNCNGLADYVGGLLGASDQSVTTITNSGNEGNLTCGSASGLKKNMGGIIGMVSGTSSPSVTLTGVYNTGNVTGDDYIGGIVGRLENTDYLIITDCYNTGTIHVDSSDTEGAGGIIGNIKGNNSEVSRCYNAGTVSIDSGSDVDLVGIANVVSGSPTFSDNFLLTGKVPNDEDGDSAEGSVLSGANMKKQASFTNFNFGTCSDGAYTTEATCEAAEETWTQVWRISEDSTYPYLYGITPTSLPGAE